MASIGTSIVLGLASVLSLSAAEHSEGPGVAYERLQPGQPGLRVGLNFPPDATVAVNRLTYRLTRHADIVVDIQASLGPDAIRPPQQINLVILVDGQQTPFAVDGRTATGRHVFALTEVGALVHFTARIKGRDLPAGQSSVAMLFYRADGGSFPCASFTVTRGGGSFRTRALDPDLHPTSPTGHATLEMRVPGTTGALMRWRMPGVAPDATGRLEVGVILQRDPAPDTVQATGAVTHAVVCVADGKQAQLRGGRLASRVVLGNGERVAGELELTALPVDGNGTPHLLGCFVLPGDGHPTESAPGVPAPWYEPPRQLGSLMW